MAGAILTRGKEGVISVWEMHDRPCFSIWENKSAPAFSCSKEEESERGEDLNTHLDFIKDSGSTASFIIKFHEQPTKGRINNNTPVIGSLPFKLNEATDVVKGGGAGGDLSLLREIFQLKIDNLEDRYNRLIEEKDEEIAALLEEAQAPAAKNEKEDFIGSIFQQAKNNGAMDKITNGIADMISDLFTGAKYKINKMNQPQQAPGISGVEPGTPPAKVIDAAVHKIVMFYVDKHGEAEGLKLCAEEMSMLANLTDDADMYAIAVKKLRALS